MAGEVLYLPSAYEVEGYICAGRSYESATFEGFRLEAEEGTVWKRAVADAENVPQVGQLLDYLRDVHDIYTIEHSQRVGELNAGVAVRLGLGGEAVRDAAVSGFLHDIGKRFFQHIIHIDGKITDEQYEEVKLHAPYGAQMVAASGLRRAIVHATGNHHGYQRDPYPTYPEALYEVGPAGPLSPDHIIGTGLAVADVFDAVRSVRPGRKQPMPLPQALEVINELRVPSDVKGAFRSLFDGAVSVADAA